MLLEVVEEVLEGGRSLAKVLNDSARALDDLAGGTIGIDFAESAPLAELNPGGDHDEVDGALVAESLHELAVSGLVAVLRKATEAGLALVERLGALVKAALEAVAVHRPLQYLLKGRHRGELSHGDLLGGDSRYFHFCVRHGDGLLLLRFYVC